MPNGVFFIHKITNISKGKNSENKFNFMYNDRLFEFQVSKPVEVQIWVLCLQFLHDHSLECISYRTKHPEMFFTNYNDVVKIRGEEDEAEDSEPSNQTGEQSEEVKGD